MVVTTFMLTVGDPRYCDELVLEWAVEALELIDSTHVWRQLERYRPQLLAPLRALVLHPVAS